MSNCIFCNGQLNNDTALCVWCGFGQAEETHIPGTLSYGTKLNDYVVGSVVAVNGESTTYMAYDTQSQQRVIIKEFLPVSLISNRVEDVVTVQPEKQVLFKNLLFDFIDLYKTLQKIESPAMPKVYRVFSQNQTAYAVLENVKGIPLKQVLIKRGKPYSFKEVRWMFQDLFNLLEKMAELNISHGGLSDETIIITPDNTVMLTGFALQDLRTKNDHLVYKLYDGFSAPEQYHSNKFQGFYTDIYSLACLVYYSVTGSLLTEAALKSKEISRFFPKYAVEALEYASKENPQQRIDSIKDFVLMLDDKGTVIKPKAQPLKSIKEIERSRLIQYIIIGIVFVLLLTLAFKSIGGSNVQQSSMDTSSVIAEMEKVVPSLLGKSYAEIINNETYQQNYTFVRLEDYSDNYNEGLVCAQSPAAGESIQAGATVYVTVSLGPQKVTVPKGLIGISYEDAVFKLERLGIKHTKEYVDQSREYVEGMVAGLSIAEGQEIKPAQEILTIYVANDKPLPTPEPIATPQPTPSPSPSPTTTPTPPSEESGETVE